MVPSQVGTGWRDRKEERRAGREANGWAKPNPRTDDKDDAAMDFLEESFRCGWWENAGPPAAPVNADQGVPRSSGRTEKKTSQALKGASIGPATGGTLPCSSAV